MAITVRLTCKTNRNHFKHHTKIDAKSVVIKTMLREVSFRITLVQRKNTQLNMLMTEIKTMATLIA